MTSQIKCKTQYHLKDFYRGSTFSFYIYKLTYTHHRQHRNENSIVKAFIDIFSHMVPLVTGYIYYSASREKIKDILIL